MTATLGGAEGMAHRSTLCRVGENSGAWLIGTPERELARRALDVHLAQVRLGEIDYQRRLGACQEARTRAELLQVFADLPDPRPDLPDLGAGSGTGSGSDDDMPALAVAGCVTIGLGLPVAVVLGLIYGAWWGLAVPVAVVVLLFVINWIVDLVTKGRRPEEE